MIRIVGLCAGDPQSERVFSGSARQLYRALERQGLLIAAKNIDRRNWASRICYARAVWRYRKTGPAKLICAWERNVIAARSRVARALLLAEPAATGALLYGTNFFPAEDGERAAVPVGAALDATFAQIARSGEAAFGMISPRDVQRLVDNQREVLSRCDVLFPRSQWCWDSLYHDYGLDPVKCVVTGAGPNFDDLPVPRQGHDCRTLLFVGRDWHRKNGQLVLDAFKEARRFRPGLRLKIVGPPVPAPVQEGVDWLGPLDGARRKELLQWYSRASLLLCPSRSEAFGIAMLEAQAAGCPVLTLDRGAAREIVVDGVTGSLVKDAEPDALAGEILRWTSDPEILERAGVKAKAHVAANYSWDMAAERVGTAFRRASLTNGSSVEGLTPARPASVTPSAATTESIDERASGRAARRSS